jgi:hypothetical protein
MNHPHQEVPLKGGVCYCCYSMPDGSRCPQPARWEIWTPPRSPDDFTHACGDHVEAMKSAHEDVVEPLTRWR